MRRAISIANFETYEKNYNQNKRGKKPSRGRASFPIGDGVYASLPTQGSTFGSSKHPIFSAPRDEINRSTANCPTFPIDRAGWNDETRTTKKTFQKMSTIMRELGQR